MSNELTSALVSLFVAAVVAALAPLVVGLIPRLRIPQVVVLIVGGVIVGPQVLDLAQPESIVLLSHVGLGFLFLLADTSWTWDSSGSGPASSPLLLGWPRL
jgi:Kef-type K+ transport system membrane component KefB